jgi:repressor LexA
MYAVLMAAEWADKLKNRRLELGITQEELALRADLSPSTITKIERGVHHPNKVTTKNLRSFIRALEWSPAQFQLETGIDLDLGHDHADPVDGFRFAPILGVASAGRPHDYPVPSHIYRPGMAVYQVSGESMHTGAPDSLNDGDYVFIDTCLNNLKDGYVYVLEIIGDGFTIKRARRLNGEWLLMSDNPSYGILKASEVRVIGEVFSALGQKNLKGK